MYAAIRPLGFSIKGYAALLAVVSTAAVVTGGAINYTHARNNPGADPYMPRPQVVIPMVPVAPIEPVPQAKVKAMPPAEQALPGAPLISNVEPRTKGLLGRLAPPQSQEADAVRIMPATTIAPAPAPPKTSTRIEFRPNPNPKIVKCQDLTGDGAQGTADAALIAACRGSGVIGEGAIGQSAIGVPIGAGNAVVVPTQ